MKITSKLATLSDTKKLIKNDGDNILDMIYEYQEILENCIDGKISITDMFKNFCQNYYVFKITFTFSNDVKYYIFYQDKEPDAGLCGFITNKQYQLLTETDEYPDRWCEDNYEGFEHIFTEEVLEDDKKYLQQIYKYFDSNYQAVTHIDIDDGSEYVDGNTDEYFNVFTLYKKNNENDCLIDCPLSNWYKIFEDDKRISSLIENMILYDVFKNYKGTYKSIKINKLDYCLEKYKDDNSFSFGWWSDNTIKNAGLVDNGATEFSYAFEINRDNLKLINQFISNDDKDYNINNLYLDLWNVVKQDNCIKNYLLEFFIQITKFINGKSDYICDECKKVFSKQNIIIGKGNTENICKDCNQLFTCNRCKNKFNKKEIYKCDDCGSLCNTCNIEVHDSRCKDLHVNY